MLKADMIAGALWRSIEKKLITSSAMSKKKEYKRFLNSYYFGGYYEILS